MSTPKNSWLDALFSSKSEVPDLPFRYILPCLVGSGSYGKVYRCTDVYQRRRVAIKYNTHKDKDVIYREYKILSELKHPNILRVYDFLHDHNAIVMEFAAYADLLDYTNKNDLLSEQQIRHIFRQLMSAVAYIHSEKYIHSDIKLENILLIDAELHIRLADFGFATQVGEKRKFKYGSELYAAPEIFTKEPVFGPELDIWSSGVVLHALAFKILPENGVIYRRKTRSEALVKLLTQMLERDAAQRISASEAMKNEWLGGSKLKIPDEVPELSILESPSSTRIPAHLSAV